MNRIKKELKSVMSLNPGAFENVFAVHFTLPPAFAGFKGHFEGYPIMPGAGLIIAAAAAVEEFLNTELKIGEIKRAKFYQPILPEKPVKMDITVEKQDRCYSVRAQVSSGGLKTARIFFFTAL